MLALPVLPLLSLTVFVAFDVFTLHRRRARITGRWQARHAGWLHVARGVAYTLQVFVVSNVWFEGALHAVFAALCGVNAAVVVIAVADMLCEPDARRLRGGLPEARTFSTSPRKIERSFVRLRRAWFVDAGSPAVGKGLPGAVRGAWANDGREATSSQTPRREADPHRPALGAAAA